MVSNASHYDKSDDTSNTENYDLSNSLPYPELPGC